MPRSAPAPHGRAEGAGAAMRFRRTDPERAARSASGRQLDRARVPFREVAREDPVLVVIEARAPAPFQQLAQFRVRARAAEVAPAVDDVNLGFLAPAVVFHDADRAAVRPGDRLQARPRGGEARGVGGGAFLARAHPRAAADLMAETGAFAGALEPQGLQAQAVLVGKAAQRLERGAPGTPQAAQAAEPSRGGGG